MRDGAKREKKKELRGKKIVHSLMDGTHQRGIIYLISSNIL